MPQEKSGSTAAPQAAATGEEIPGERAASAAERLSRLYDVALKSTAEGILGIDAAGVVDFANPAAARLLGRPIEDLVGHAARDILGTARLFLPSAEMPGKACFLRGSGHPFVAEFRLSPRAEGDPRQGAVMVFADITACQAEVWELQASNARLREALLSFHEKKRPSALRAQSTPP